MTASIVPVAVARSRQLHPMLHVGGFEYEQLAAGLLETHEVSEMHLQLDQLSHGLLIV